MNLKILIGALRAGQELPHTTGVKWAGIAFTGVSLALTTLAGLAMGRGWIPSEIPPEQIYELSSLLVSAALGVLGYIQVATSARVGLLPDNRRVRGDDDEHAHLGDSPDDRGASERMQPDELPPGRDASKSEPSRRSGFPDGPFFRN